MNVFRRVVGILMAATMLISVPPVAAYAQKNETTIESVQVNQVGYLQDTDKMFAVSRTTNDELPMTFALTDTVSDKIVYTGQMEKAPTPYAGTVHEWPSTYYTGDFTAYTVPGTYTITVACGDERKTSCPFAIGNAAALYTQPLQAILAYFRGERDTANTHITNPFDNNNPIDLHGGWYDASNRPAVYMGYIDNYNYMVCCIEGNTGYQLFSAYEANPSLYDAVDYNHNDVPDVLEEAVWGCDWYVRLKPQDITGGYFYNGPEHGRIHTNESVKVPVAIRLGAGTAIAALAMGARYGIDGDFTAEEYGENAKQAWDWYIQNNETQACEDGMEHLMDDIYWAVAGLEMYKTFEEQTYLDETMRRIEAILARQTGDDQFDGWFELGMEEQYNNTEGGPYHNWLDEAAVLYPLIGYAKAFPQDTERVARIRTAVERYMDHKVEVADTTGSNPYGYAKEYYREEVTDPDSTVVRFFQHENGHATSAGPNTKSWVSGENGRLLSLTYASLLANEFLNTDKYLAYGLNQLNWVYGVNPFAAAMQCGIGEGRNLAEEIGFGGTVPYGGFINGIRGDYKNKVTSSAGYLDSRDYPFIDNSYWTGEWFLPIGTAGIMALTKLVAEDEAMILPKDVPCEAEKTAYLLTTAHGSSQSGNRFEIMAQPMSGASKGVALTGIDAVNEGAIWTNAPQATSVSIRYAAEQAGSFHLFVGDNRQTIYLPATGGADVFDTVSVWAAVEEGDTVSLQYQEGDMVITLDYILFKDDTVTAVKHTQITTVVGEEPVWPDAVSVTYSDGTTGLQPVNWKKPTDTAYEKAGCFIVEGQLRDVDTIVQATVTVYDSVDMVWIEPSAVATSVGVKPALPNDVTVYYPNGAALQRPVTWQSMDEKNLNEAGSFTLEGVVDGTDTKVMLTVTVLKPFPDGVSDLLFGKKVTASGSNSINHPENAIDGDVSTRWESTVNGDEHQWLEIDLGKSYRVGSAAIVWEAAYAKEYRVQISQDRQVWTELYYTDASDGGTDDIVLDTVGQGRYLRLDCLTRGHASWKAYSVYEFRAYGAAGAADYHPAEGIDIVSDTTVLSENGQVLPLSAAFWPKNTSMDTVVWSVTDVDGHPTDAAVIDYTGRLTAVKNGMVRVTATAVDGSGCQGSRLFTIVGQSAGNIAQGKTASAQYALMSPNLAVDGDMSTRYGGKYGEDDQWFQVDLGEKQPINRVTIRWENAYASAYELLVSDNGADWRPVYTTTAGTGGVENRDFDTVQTRYVRLHSIKAATSYGISIWEFEAYYVPEMHVTAADVAAALEDWPSPIKGGRTLLLPQQPGFTTAIVSSSQETVVHTDGQLTPIAGDATVELTLQITSQTDSTDTVTKTMALHVPGLGEHWAALRQKLQTLESFEQSDSVANASAQWHSQYAAAKQLAATADEKGATAQPLMTLALELLQQTENSLCVLGDVDENGKVEAADALLALQAATGKIHLSGRQQAAADVDGQPGVMAADALMILQYATKKITAFK